MNRQRSVSASESGPRSIWKRSPPAARPRTKVHSTSSISYPSKCSMENSRAALAQVLLDYNFVGKIVKIKTEDGYGFLSSEQITGDVFFSLHNFTCPEHSLPNEFIGKFATFQIKSVGKRFMEARKIEAKEIKPEIKYLDGVLVEWLRSGSGCLIQVTSGLGASKPHNRIFAPMAECPLHIEEGVKVKLRVHMDRSLRVEARHITEANDPITSGGDSPGSTKSETSAIAVEPHCSPSSKSPVKSIKDIVAINEKIIKDLTNLDLSEGLIKTVEAMNTEELTNFFETNLKSRLTELSQQPVASKVIISVIRIVSKTGCHKIEGTITRTILGSFLTLSSCKQGCQVVQAALDHFSESSRMLIAEQLTELGTVDEFTDLWAHGGHVFMSMLDHLDETSLAMIGDCLLGNYFSLSCNICHYKPLRALLTHLVNTDCFDEIVEELTENIISLSCDKYGHHIIICLLENAPEQVKLNLVEMFKGRIMELSLDPVCYSVIVKAIIEGSSNQQAEMIEEVCKVTSKQAEMDILTLAMDKHGHEVVLAMLSGTRHKHIHNILKASILCKQEELLENVYAARVFKEIKMEYHNKLSGNYPHPKCH